MTKWEYFVVENLTEELQINEEKRAENWFQFVVIILIITRIILTVLKDGSREPMIGMNNS